MLGGFDRRVTMTLDDKGIFRRRNTVDLVLGDLDDVGARGEDGRVG